MTFINSFYEPFSFDAFMKLINTEFDRDTGTQM